MMNYLMREIKKSYREFAEIQHYISATRNRKYLILTTGRAKHQIEKILEYLIETIS